MKIGLVCPYNIFKNGGVQECVRALQSEYAAHGHEATIITPRPVGVETESFDGIRLVGASRDMKSPLHTTAQVSVTLDSTAIDALLEDMEFDIIHFHEPWVPIVSRQILTRSHAVNVATFHAKLPETMMSKTLEKVITPYTRSILKYIDAFTAVSDAAAEYARSLSDAPMTLIPNGIDIEKFSSNPTKAKRADNLVVYVGRLEKRKGVSYLIDAFAILQREMPDARLVIAGDGPDRVKLETQVKEYGLDNVEFLGFIDEAVKIELLHQATVFCSPALYGESFGIVLLEAMAAGAVTVAGNNPGYAGVMQDKGSISLVNVKDTAEFGRRLSLLMRDTELRELWSKWAADYVRQFNYTHIAELYLETYKQALKEHR